MEMEQVQSGASASAQSMHTPGNGSGKRKCSPEVSDRGDADRPLGDKRPNPKCNDNGDDDDDEKVDDGDDYQVDEDDEDDEDDDDEDDDDDDQDDIVAAKSPAAKSTATVDKSSPNSLSSSSSSSSRRRKKPMVLACDEPNCMVVCVDAKQMRYHKAQHSWGPHEIIVEDGVTKFRCANAQCGRVVLDRKVLRKHLLTHRPRIFVCPRQGCGKSFYERAKLKRHDLVHTGEKKFTCTFEGCAKSFAYKANLKTHLRTHSGERPYVCQFQDCRKRFAQASNRNSHYLTHMRKAGLLDATTGQQLFSAISNAGGNEGDKVGDKRRNRAGSASSAGSASRSASASGSGANHGTDLTFPAASRGDNNAGAQGASSSTARSSAKRARVEFGVGQQQGQQQGQQHHHVPQPPPQMSPAHLQLLHHYQMLANQNAHAYAAASASAAAATAAAAAGTGMPPYQHYSTLPPGHAHTLPPGHAHTLPGHAHASTTPQHKVPMSSLGALLSLSHSSGLAAKSSDSSTVAVASAGVTQADETSSGPATHRTNAPNRAMEENRQSGNAEHVSPPSFMNPYFAYLQASAGAQPMMSAPSPMFAGAAPRQVDYANAACQAHLNAAVQHMQHAQQYSNANNAGAGLPPQQLAPSLPTASHFTYSPSMRALPPPTYAAPPRIPPTAAPSDSSARPSGSEVSPQAMFAGWNPAAAHASHPGTMLPPSQPAPSPLDKPDATRPTSQSKPPR